jgi:hypothetical protein
MNWSKGATAPGGVAKEARRRALASVRRASMILRLLADADRNGSIVSGVIRRNPEFDFKRAVVLKGI